MAASLVQTRASSTDSVTAVNLAYTSNVTSGNLLFALVGGGSDAGGGVRAVSDSQGNAYTFVAGAGSLDDASNVNLYIATAGASGANTVTWTLTAGAPGTMDIIIGEVSGLTATPLDQHHSVNESAATGNITTTQAAEYLLAGAIGNSAAIATWSATNSFVVERSVAESSGTSGMALADRTVAAIGTYSTTFSNSGVLSPSAGALIASFNIAAAPAGPTKLEISLFGTKRFGKTEEPECVEAPTEPPVKLFGA